MVEIRNAQGSDAPYLYNICLKTALYGKDGTDYFYDSYMVGQSAVAPYLFYDKKFCFVADLDNIPSGYVVGVKDSLDFYKWKEKEWMPILRKRYTKTHKAKTQCEQEIIDSLQTSAIPDDISLLKEYPSHLHINLLQEIQGKGVGKKLIHTLFDALRKENVSALHLSIWKSNEDADAFYRKVGFHVLSETEKGRLFGIKL